MAKSEFIVLLNISRWNNPKKPGQGVSVDVVTEVRDGKSWGTGVQKVYFIEDGGKRIPQIMLTRDFKACGERWPQIKDLMEHPPALPEVAPPTSDKIVEVPF